MVLLFAPLLSVIAAAVGGVASVVAFLMGGPRRLRGSGEPPMVVVPPVPTPEELRRAEADGARAAR